MIIVVFFVVVTFVITLIVNLNSNEDLILSILLGALFSFLGLLVGCLISLIGSSCVGYNETLSFREVISVRESNVVFTEKNEKSYALLFLADGDTCLISQKSEEIKGDKSSDEIFIIHDIIKKEGKYKYLFIDTNNDCSKYYFYKGKIKDLSKIELE